MDAATPGGQNAIRRARSHGSVTKASDLLVAALENEGIARIFALPGEENLDVLESLRHSKIKLVLTRHEQGARDGGAARAQPRRPRARGSRLRDDPVETGGRRLCRFRTKFWQSGLRRLRKIIWPQRLARRQYRRSQDDAGSCFPRRGRASGRG